MNELKRFTVQGPGGQSQTVALVEQRGRYVTVDAETGDVFDDPVASKQDANRRFQNTIEHIRTGMAAEAAEGHMSEFGLPSLGLVDDLGGSL